MAVIRTSSALEQNAAASEFYRALNRHSRYAIYYRVQEAQRAETRFRRSESIIGKLARGETVHRLGR